MAETQNFRTASSQSQRSAGPSGLPCGPAGYGPSSGSKIGDGWKLGMAAAVLALPLIFAAARSRPASGPLIRPAARPAAQNPFPSLPEKAGITWLSVKLNGLTRSFSVITPKALGEAEASLLISDWAGAQVKAEPLAPPQLSAEEFMGAVTPLLHERPASQPGLFEYRMVYITAKGRSVAARAPFVLFDPEEAPEGSRARRLSRILDKARARAIGDAISLLCHEAEGPSGETAAGEIGFGN